MPHSKATQYLREYVAIPSVNPMGRVDIPRSWVGEDAYARCVQAHLARLGVDSQVIGREGRSSVVGVVSVSDPAADTLMVASHLDTVPVDGMSIDPFDPVVSAGRLQGRGACDTKAGLAALMAALERVLSKGSLRRNLVVVGEADEESESIGVQDVADHLGLRRVDFAIATEPTELRLISAHKGTAWIRVEASGRACHSSDPSAGRNAIYALAPAISSLQRLGARLLEQPHATLGPATLSVGLIGGGHAPNIVPDKAWLLVDRRTLPGESVESIRDEIEQAFAADGVQEDVRVSDIRPGKLPLDTPRQHVALQRCLAALSQQGCSSEPQAVAFGTDAGLFAARGIPSVVLGPGSIRQAHTADEYVELEQVERMVSVYEALLEASG